MTLFKLGARTGGPAGPPAACWALLVLILFPAAASAQIIEGLGSRALGMGGAFVAVANDSSATWWNPGALADGPFLDATIGYSTTEVDLRRPAARTSVTGFSLTTPPAGISYYRFRLTEIPTESAQPGREDEQGGIPLRALSAAQIGVTLVHSLRDGIHVGGTFKYIRGTLRTEFEDVVTTMSPAAMLDHAGDLEGGETEHRFDFDLGLLAVFGPTRLGVVAKNIAGIEFETPDGYELMRLPRQLRVGGAYDLDGKGVPLTLSADADLAKYDTAYGERRVVALGGEHWVVRKRVALRGGARFNTVGNEGRAATAGATVAIRPGLFVDGHFVRGGEADEQGWGVAARVSF